MRHAILIANSAFPSANPKDLPALRCPPNDIAQLRKPLEDPQRGNYQIQWCCNETSSTIKKGIESVLRSAASQNEVALIYYSGHGLLDENRNLFLAAYDSEPTYMDATMVGASFIGDVIKKTRAKKVLVVLDCCFAGAAGGSWVFRGAGGAIESPEVQELWKHSEARFSESVLQSEEDIAPSEGIFLMTACQSIERAAEPASNGDHGVFTKYIVEKLESSGSPGETSVTVGALFDHVCQGLHAEKESAQAKSLPYPHQSPGLWSYKRKGPELIVSEMVMLPGVLAEPIPRDQRWKLITDLRRPFLDLIGPCYILDHQYHFVDWNSVFEEIIARPLKLTRGAHAAEFIKHLNDFPGIVDRSNEVFKEDSAPPLVDVEILELNTAAFGVIRFDKIACQIPSASGTEVAWCVNLNISHVERAPEFWNKMTEILNRAVNWSRYAETYDLIVSPFSEYKKLVNQVVTRVGDAKKIVDIGAGTGGATLKLLEEPRPREIWAVENNEAMLRRLQEKLTETKLDRQPGKHVVLCKGDAISVLREEQEGCFDACVMLNVLFALEEPAVCLREVYRVLAPGGTLVLSTSHWSTDVERLLEAIKAEMIRENRFNGLAEAFEETLERNRAMSASIRRDSKTQIRRYIENAGFESSGITEWVNSAYVDSVVIVKAVKSSLSSTIRG